MRRALAGVVALGMLAVLAGAALDRRDVAFAVGQPSIGVAAVLGEKSTACRQVDLAAGFSLVRFPVGTFHRPGPPLVVSVGGRVRRVPGGYADNAGVEAAFGPIAPDGSADVCIHNPSDRRIALYGLTGDEPRIIDPSDQAIAEIGLVFARDEPRSLLSLVPVALDRAARFKPAWAGPWTYWALLVAVGAGLPLLLARAASASASTASRSS